MAQLMLVNPAKRRRKSPAKKRRTGIVTRAKSTVSTGLKKIRRSYRRNPIDKSAVFDQFKDGAIGAAGALAVDVAMAKLPIPASLKTGQMKPIIQGLVGIGIGMAVSKFGKNKSLGRQLAGGAVTVSLYNAGRQMLAPTLGLSLSGDDTMLAYTDMGEYDSSLFGYDNGLLGDDEMGAYDEGMGYYTGAPIL